MKLSTISFSLLKSFCSCSFFIFSVEISMSSTFNSWFAFIIWLRVSSYMLETLASSIDFSSNLLARFFLSTSIIALSSMALFFCSVTSQSIMACTMCHFHLWQSLFFSLGISTTLPEPLQENAEWDVSQSPGSLWSSQVCRLPSLDIFLQVVRFLLEKTYALIPIVGIHKWEDLLLRGGWIRSNKL